MNQMICTVMVGATLLLSGTIRAMAQQEAGAHNDTRAMTRQQADEILQQLKILRQLLQTQHSGESVEVKVSDIGYSIGRPDAPLTLVEFSDYQCPFCVQFQNDNFQKLRQEYIETGKLRFVIRDFPLVSHGYALKAAEAARCGGDQGKFWEMRDALVSHFKDLKGESLSDYAQQVGLNIASFEQCLDTDKFLPGIEQDEADAKAAGIRATPSFVLGRANNGVVDGVRLVGAMPYDSLSQQIASQLRAPEKAAGRAAEAGGEVRSPASLSAEVSKH